jgi:hypothetical protein
MDAIVEAALRKWPNVPHCYGWLGLDARGDWFLRDLRTQAQGEFPQSKGSRIEHAGLRAFIERNYAHDDQGCWFFQNGPQRVYVELELAPWIWRLAARGAGFEIESHTNVAAAFEAGWVDEHGHLFVKTPLGLGSVHSLDMHVAALAVESVAWTINETGFATLAARFGHVLSPAALRASNPP